MSNPMIPRGLLIAVLALPSSVLAGASGAANNSEAAEFISISIDFECPDNDGLNTSCEFEIFTDDGGTATPDVDFAPREPVYFHAPQGTSSYPGNYELTVYDDEVDELDETIRIVVITKPEQIGPDETSHLYATILDDDEPAVVEPDCKEGPLSTLIDEIAVAPELPDPGFEALACALAELGL